MFEKYIQRYEDELTRKVIPFWEEHCQDKEYGGYFTCLDRDGSVYDSEKYMWMQWRIVYMFAMFYMTPYRKESFLPIAEQGFEFLTKYGKSPDGTYYFALNRKGVPSVAPYNIFSDCFAAMGAAALYRATGEERYKHEADSAMQSYIRRMDSPKGRWEKGLEGRQPRLALAHFMILANLAAVMKEMLGSDEYEVQADEAVKTVVGRFWNPEKRVLFENINADGTFDLDSCEGRFINPGHGLESMWFMLQYAERKNNHELIEKCADIIKGLFEFGTDRKHGGLFYFMDVLGKPHLELQWDMKLWWPHCEAMIAALYAYRLTSEQYFLDRFKEIDEYAWSHFRDPEFPEWYAYLNRAGEPTHLLKGGKWKTFFHLPRALYLCVEQMKKIDAKGM
ncbi:MAG: AGE family epimerase/isomerase [Lentisphaeria bacterium]|nr:AGE family epimerase/isomerase [Lentisphaeria bacterium]